MFNQFLNKGSKSIESIDWKTMRKLDQIVPRINRVYRNVRFFTMYIYYVQLVQLVQLVHKGSHRVCVIHSVLYRFVRVHCTSSTVYISYVIAQLFYFLLCALVCPVAQDHFLLLLFLYSTCLLLLVIGTYFKVHRLIFTIQARYFFFKKKKIQNSTVRTTCCFGECSKLEVLIEHFVLQNKKMFYRLQQPKICRSERHCALRKFNIERTIYIYKFLTIQFLRLIGLDQERSEVLNYLRNY